MATVPLQLAKRGGGEWVSLAGLRTDGRRPHEIRRLRYVRVRLFVSSLWVGGMYVRTLSGQPLHRGKVDRSNRMDQHARTPPVPPPPPQFHHDTPTPHPAHSCTLGAQGTADGSALLEQGQTRVLAIVHGPHEVSRRSDALHDRALLECSLHHAPFAGLDRKRRRATDRGSLEMALAVRFWFCWGVWCLRSVAMGWVFGGLVVWRPSLAYCLNIPPPP